MKISKGTIIRTILMGIVIINMILKANGIELISISESEIATVIEYVLEIAVIVANWWYNNSFSAEAKKAQQYLEQLKASK